MKKLQDKINSQIDIVRKRTTADYIMFLLQTKKPLQYEGFKRYCGLNKAEYEELLTNNPFIIKMFKKGKGRKKLSPLKKV